MLKDSVLCCQVIDL